MIKFNDDNIYVGYIKQLLANFHLPTVKCYTENLPLCDGLLYIKDNYIKKYNEQEKSFYPIVPFSFNKHILNYTKNLKINNILYDSHTHEYLGEYLRFIRDYKKVNLMSLYNCFSNHLVSSLYVKIKEQTTTDPVEEFKTEDKKYKIYCFPVKFFQKYTISLSSIEPIEIICGFYTKSFLDSTKPSSKFNISEKTHIKTIKTSFSKPFIYDKLDNEIFKDKELLEHEKDLKMFIKVSLYNNTSIVVLEGVYLNTNCKTFNNKTSKWENTSMIVNYNKPLIDKNKNKVESKTYPQEFTSYDSNTGRNHTVYQYYVTDQPNNELNNIQYTSSLQLLEVNSNTSFPFSNRLLEYLINNPIDKSEVISDNIQRLQHQLKRRKEEGFTTNYPFYDKETESIKYTSGYTKVGLNTIKTEGIWEDKYKAILYDIANETGLLDTAFDILGYLDKDVETKIGSDIDIYSKE